MEAQERSARLQAEVARLAREGWLVASQSPFAAQLSRNRLMPTDRQLFVTVTEDGRIERTKPKVSGSWILFFFGAVVALALGALVCAYALPR